jgi:hypothetical protein
MKLGRFNHIGAAAPPISIAPNASKHYNDLIM